MLAVSEVAGLQEMKKTKEKEIEKYKKYLNKAKKIIENIGENKTQPEDSLEVSGPLPPSLCVCVGPPRCVCVGPLRCVCVLDPLAVCVCWTPSLCVCVGPPRCVRVCWTPSLCVCVGPPCCVCVCVGPPRCVCWNDRMCKDTQPHWPTGGWGNVLQCRNMCGYIYI